MTSEIRVNKLTNRIGLSTVTFADSGIGVTVTGRIDPDTDSARDLGTTSVRWRNGYFDTLYGDGSNLTGLSGLSVANQADNRLLTATGTTDALNGEANLTFDGTQLQIGGDSTVAGTFGLEIYNTASSEGTALIAGDAGARLDIMDTGSSERLRIAAAGAAYFLSLIHI